MSDVAMHEFVHKVIRKSGQLRKKHPELRLGQSYMDALWDLDREMYNSISQSDFDCYYDDKRCDFFLEAVNTIAHDNRKTPTFNPKEFTIDLNGITPSIWGKTIFINKGENK